MKKFFVQTMYIDINKEFFKENDMEIKALKELLPYCLENCTKKTLAVIKAEDDHTLTAVARARKEGAIEAVLIGDAPVIKNLLAQIGEKEEDYHIIDEAGEREAILKAIELVHAGEVDFLRKDFWKPRT